MLYEELDWKDYPAHTPTKNGYYMVLFQLNNGERHYKPIYWDTWLWVRWRMDIEIIIEKFAPSTWDPHYTGCLRTIENV